MKKAKKYLKRIYGTKIFKNEKVQFIYENSDFAMYIDNVGIYYLDELNYSADIEYCCCGSLKDIENYIIEVFSD